MRSTAALLSVGSFVAYLHPECFCPLGSELAVASSLFVETTTSESFVPQRTLQEVLDLDLRAVREMKAALEIEPRRADYKLYSLDAMKDLAKAYLDLRAHAEVVRVANELAELWPKDISTRLTSAEYIVRAMAQVRVDSSLDQETAQRFVEKYAALALQNLRDVERMSEEDGQVLELRKTDLALDKPYWKRAMERPDFQAFMKQMDEKAKGVDN
jgi:hypothetical protein